jgi:hypothetical protein
LAIKLRKKICRTFFNERQFKCFIWSSKCM